MKTIIVSLGGSVINPDKIDYEFLGKFKKMIFGVDDRFVVCCGGGARARKWQNLFPVKIKYFLDWVGIFATRKNAKFVKRFFGNDAYEKIIINPTKEIKTDKKVIIAAGWKPGWSTDYDAVLLAKNVGADIIVNVTNVDYVYNRDPKLKGAKKLEKLTWKKMREICGSEWRPGLNKPFDPMACREAEKLKLRVVIASKDVDNLRNFFDGKKFKGSVIK